MENQGGCTLDPSKYHCACFDRETLTCSNTNYCGFKVQMVRKKKEPKWFEKYYKNYR